MKTQYLVLHLAVVLTFTQFAECFLPGFAVCNSKVSETCKQKGGICQSVPQKCMGNITKDCGTTSTSSSTSKSKHSSVSITQTSTTHSCVCCIKSDQVDLNLSMQSTTRSVDIDSSGLALLTAARYGDITVVRAELAKGIDPDWHIKLSQIFGDDNSIRLGVEIDEATQFTPLMIAVQYGHADIVELLINENANVNFQGIIGMSPICIAAWLNMTEIVKHLLQGGADPKQKDYAGFTAVDYAKVNGNNQVKSILENFNREDGRDMHTNTVVTGDNSSVTNSDYLISKIMLDMDMSGLALLTAASYGDITVVRAELAKGIDPDWHIKLSQILGDDDNSWLGEVVGEAAQITPLMAAVTYQYADIVELLINENANVNFRGIVGRSPIFIAARLNMPDIAKLLLQGGADPKQKDDIGFTAVDYAKVKYNLNVKSILENFNREDGRDQHTDTVDTEDNSSVTKVMVHWVLMYKLVLLLFLFY